MTKKILAVLLAFLYSVVYLVVGPTIKARSFTFGTSRLLQLFLCFLVCSVINLIIFSVIPKCRFPRLNAIDRSLSQFFDKIGDKGFFCIVWAVIFVSWIPAYLILYPGVLSYDAISQVGSAMGEITNNHHPVLHTWLIRVFMRLGDGLFASYEFGLGLMSLLQMVILSYALTRLVMLLKKKKVPALIVLLTAVCSAFWFQNAILSVTVVKDTFHAAFLVLFACHFTEIVTNPAEYSSRRRNLIWLPVIAFFMCAFRNNGIYIYVFCFLVLLILRLPKIKRAKTYIPLMVAIALPVVLFKIYTGPVFAALGISPGQVREALCVPIQQLQYVAIDKADELTDQQTELMSYYIDNLEWREGSNGREYDPFFADPAKSSFYSNRYEEDPVAFWKFYLQIGKQYPAEYVVAFLSNTLGYWYPGYYGFSYVMYDNYPAESFAVPLERKCIVHLPLLEKYYRSVCTSDSWRQTIGIRMFFVSGFAPWILAFALVLSWRRKGFWGKDFPLFLPLIAQYGIMILSPMSSFRYSWPLYLLLPITFIGVFGKQEEQ